MKKEFIIFVPDVEPKIWEGGIIMRTRYAYDKFRYKNILLMHIITLKVDSLLNVSCLFTSSALNIVACFISAFVINIQLIILDSVLQLVV